MKLTRMKYAGLLLLAAAPVQFGCHSAPAVSTTPTRPVSTYTARPADKPADGANQSAAEGAKEGGNPKHDGSIAYHPD